jgi:DNA-binding beta-propeller fold protein YncE
VLTLLDQERAGVGGVVDLLQPERLALSPDGRHLYVSSPVRDDILVFRRDLATGELTFVDDTNPFIPLQPAQLTGLAISPDGLFVYAAFRAGRVRWYGRNPATGLLTAAGDLLESDPSDEFLSGANELLLSRDGRFLYVAAATDAGISVLSRDPATGAVAFLQGTRPEVGPQLVLHGVSGLALSPDGENLYAASATDGTLAVFERRGDGRLLFRQQLRDGVAGADRLGGLRSVVVSPDGRRVYAVGAEGVSILERSDTGLLVRRLDEALFAGSGVITNATGDRLYLTAGSPASGAVGAFPRDIAAGTIGDALGTLVDGNDGIQFLQGARSPVLSPGGSHVYVVARDDEAVTAAATGDDGRLALAASRFRVKARYTTPQGASGEAQALALSTDTGYMYFFDLANIELVIKVLDGCAINDRFWVFIGGITNVRVDLEVEDTESGAVKTYVNPQGTPFVPRQDTSAFATCP